MLPFLFHGFSPFSLDAAPFIAYSPPSSDNTGTRPVKKKDP
jgi:hypothetical protein